MRVSEATLVEETEQEINGWRSFPLDQFVHENLLLFINHEILWPAGLCLVVKGPAYEEDPKGTMDWSEATIGITEAVPMDSIVSGEADVEGRLARAREFLKQRQEDIANG